MTLDTADQTFLERINQFKQEWTDFYRNISAEKTPERDKFGDIVSKRPDGYEYIEERYMRQKLDEHFPGWSWEAAAPLHFLGSEWVVAQGHLIIPDPFLVTLGIQPPVRKFLGVDSVRVQYAKGKEHTAVNIVDVGDNCKSANSAALKYAINRLCHIGDDIYGKRVDFESMGTEEEFIESKIFSVDGGSKAALMEYISKHFKPPSKALKVLGLNSFDEITDIEEAYSKLKEDLGL